MRSALDEIVLDGARRVLAAALEAEVDAYIAGLADERDERCRRLVVRNGHAEPRTITTTAGRIDVAAPRVNDKRVDQAGQRCRFRSSILPPLARKSPKVAEALPLMYLHGMSTGDFPLALARFFGSAAGLSASVITRLTTQWQAEARAFAGPDLERDFVYVWADGRPLQRTLEEQRLCAMVMVGVRADGTKELVAITDGWLCQAGLAPPCFSVLAPPSRQRRWVPSPTLGRGSYCLSASRPRIFTSSQMRNAAIGMTSTIMASGPRDSERNQTSSPAISSPATRTTASFGQSISGLSPRTSTSHRQLTGTCLASSRAVIACQLARLRPFAARVVRSL
jgi:putative transposase